MADLTLPGAAVSEISDFHGPSWPSIRKLKALEGLDKFLREKYFGNLWGPYSTVSWRFDYRYVN